MAKNYRKRKPRQPRVNKTKKLVTGQGPTLLERLAAQSNNIGTVAKAILPIALAINTEMKYSDSAQSLAAYNPGTNDNIQSLTNIIAQGTSDTTRIGDSILAKHINMKINVLWAPAAAVLNSFSRVIVFVWKENLQINAPTAAKLFTTPANFLSGFNKDYTDQMVILKDKIITHNAQIASTAVQAVHSMKLFKKLDFHMRFQAGSSTDGTTNHIYICCRNSSAVVANNAVFDIYSRISYTDN